MNNNMNDAPTKEELLAAGAYKLVGFRIFEFIDNNTSVKISYSTALTELSISNTKSCTVCWTKENATKQDVQDAHKLLFGKELDFTLKEKTYSWDEVFGKMDNHQKNRIDSLLHNIRNSEIQNDPLEKKLTALVKLEYIIKAIEADCNTIGGIDSVFHPVYLGGSFRNLCIEACAYTNNVSPVCSKSEEAIETLIKHHPDLIKDALGVEC